MAIKYENYCSDCETCSPYCNRKHVPVWYCDRCGEENVDLFDYDGQELCEECVLKALPMIHHE